MPSANTQQMDCERKKGVARAGEAGGAPHEDGQGGEVKSPRQPSERRLTQDHQAPPRTLAQGPDLRLGQAPASEVSARPPGSRARVPSVLSGEEAQDLG